MRYCKFLIIFIALSLLFSIVGELKAQDVVSAKIEPETIKIGQKGQISVNFLIPPGHHQSLEKDYFFIKPEERRGIHFEPTIYPARLGLAKPGQEGKKDDNGIINYHNKVTLTKEFTITKEIKPGFHQIKVIAGYQLCDDAGMCLFPEEVELVLPVIFGSISQKDSIPTLKEIISTKHITSDYEFNEIKKLLDDFDIAGVAAGYQKSDKFISFLESGTNVNSSTSNLFAGKSIWLIILLILIGGIALNLTPCVLPMIPITIAVLGAGTQAESKKRGFLIGGIYGFGMTLAYGTLGLIVVLTGSQFGTINSSPWFNIIIAAVFILLALAMFDIIPIDFSKFRSGNIQGKGRGKFITVFVLGIIAAILAGACVAPVLISVILYSTTLYAKGNSAGLLLPFLLGAGMAIPWPFAGAGLSFLPKPGKWMELVKYIFGVIIFIIAIYYGYTGVKIFQNRMKPVEQVAVTKEKSTLPWTYSLTEGLEKARKEGKPIMIDFWATWCKNCLVMDATTFKAEKVVKKLDDFIVVKYKAENLKKSPTKEILDYFGVIGLPTYVMLIPK
ncbi:MAG: cytochrome c biogenesis protein CcdA [Candidatus Cloacimonadota bacterium]|nr:cytochrome c biogenesis protein CcdA [Candidatus Cloacimonadota bacterium]